MTRFGIPFVVAALAAVGLQTAVPPPPQQPVRDPGAAPQKGTGAIVGAVLSSDASAQPIRRATVTLSGGGLRGNRQAVTDGSGRFVIPDLPAGNFTVTASKPSYLSMSVGAKQPGQAGTPIIVVPGAQTPVDVRLPRGAVITGTVLDQFGRPRSQVRVQVMQYRTLGGQRRLSTSYSTSTDDRGNYRAWGLQAGDFVVAALPSSSADVRTMTAEELRWAQASPHAAYAGTAPALPPPPSPGPTMGLSPIYFPGVAELANATAITVSYGDERTGIDFQLQAVPTARIEGVVLDAEGKPAPRPNLRLVSDERLRSPGSAPQFGLPFESPRFDSPAGKFSFVGVPPGRYAVLAESVVRTPGAAQTPATSTTFWAMAQVDVAGVDVSNVTLTLQAGAAISGRVVFEGKTPVPELNRVRINMSPIEPLPIGGSVPGVAVSADGSFVLRGALPGRYRLTGSAPPSAPGSAWMLKSVAAGGRDALDNGLDVQGSEVGAVVVTFTDRVSEISGTLLDAAGLPPKDLWVVCFSTDQAFWTAQSRRTRMIRPNPDTGAFRLSQWPPGEYFLAAVMDGDTLDLTDTATMNQIGGAALRITLAEGGKLVQDLKVAR